MTTRLLAVINKTAAPSKIALARLADIHRGRTKRMSPRIYEELRSLYPAKKGRVVYRGLLLDLNRKDDYNGIRTWSQNVYEKVKDKVGQTITWDSKTCMSCTSSLKTARYFTYVYIPWGVSYQLILKYVLTKAEGIDTTQMPAWMLPGKQEWGDEREVILPPGKYKVKIFELNKQVAKRPKAKGFKFKGLK